MMRNQIVTVRDLTFVYRKRKSLFRHEYNTVLDSVDFNIYEGETLGIIGRNGCGKSSLLQLLAGIYTPDLGLIDTQKKSVSLLSLSVGFDGELVGIDNILLSGMLLGFSKGFVHSKISQIIEFSELADYIYEPLKTYSAGMRMRLGFSIAIYLKPDILLIDEVLGVGDAHFRKKAEAEMLRQIKSDATVVLVSHMAHQVSRLCDRVIWLESGNIKREGSPGPILEEYESYLDEVSGVGRK